MILAEQMEIIKEIQKQKPVKVVSLARRLGLNVYVSDLPDDISGMIKKDNINGGESGYAIFVNRAHSANRRRFTIAHEIAHYILHQNLIGDGIAEDALLRSSRFSNGIERQANALAANILMPLDQVESEMQKTPSIEALAAKFNVSRDAMSYRVLGLSYDDAQARGLPSAANTPPKAD